MEKVWQFMLVAFLGCIFLLPEMALSQAMKDSEIDEWQDAARSSYILASLYDDPEFMESIGAGLGSLISFDEERLAKQVRSQFGEELIGFILVTEGYIRIDAGEGLGVPRYYRSVGSGGVCTWYQREKLVGYTRGEEEAYVACDTSKRDAAVYAVEDSMGLERVPMRAGLRVFLSKKVVLPWLGGTKVWKKQRECRIFIK